MRSIEDYFSYNGEANLQGDEIYKLLTEVSILEAENYLYKENMDVSNIYFKLLAQVLFLENNFEENKSEIAYIYYLIGYYIGLFLHPCNGDELAINYINKAINLESNSEKINTYRETIRMINRDL